MEEFQTNRLPNSYSLSRVLLPAVPGPRRSGHCHYLASLAPVGTGASGTGHRQILFHHGVDQVEQPTRIPSVCCWNKWTCTFTKDIRDLTKSMLRGSEATRPREHPVSAEQLRELRQTLA